MTIILSMQLVQHLLGMIKQIALEKAFLRKIFGPI